MSKRVPRRIGAVLDNVDKGNQSGFPYPLFDFIANNGDRILNRFFQAFETSPSTGDAELDEASQEYLRRFPPWRRLGWILCGCASSSA